MSISSYASFSAKVAAPFQTISFAKVTNTTVSGRTFSFWQVAPFAGAAPTTAAVPTRATTGAMGQFNSSGIQRVANSWIGCGNPGMLYLCDRLSHQGGLSGTTTGAQTTNLATAALTRYTSGVGVFAAIEIYSQVGTTGTTVTVSYTNTDSTSGKTSPDTAFGATGFREANRFVILPLASGDVGVKSVESVTLAASTTTAGNFGVTLFKPLIAFTGVMTNGNIVSNGMFNHGCVPRVYDDACLFWVFMPTTSSSGGTYGTVSLVEE